MYNQLLVKQISMKWDCEMFLSLAGLTQWRLMLSSGLYKSTVALLAVVTTLRYIMA